MIRKLLYFFILVAVAACNPLNPSRMFKTPKDYKYAQTPSDTLREYKISANDIIQFRIFSNDGFKLIDLTSLNENVTANAALRNSLDYLVEFDGNVKLPILGRIMIKGLTIREAEAMLESKYSLYYNKPFIMLNVQNRRVIVFPGSESAAKVINLTNESTTLLEALALAGGISKNGKAKRVKLIRGDLKNPEIYLIDLSTIEGIKKADLVLQANDVIYVEPIPNVLQGVAAELSPVLTIVSTLLLFYTLVTRATN